MPSAWNFLVSPFTFMIGDIGDMIGPIVIFLVIVVQMIRAARTFTRNKPRPMDSRETIAKPRPLSPEEELRDFLGGLSGEHKQNPAPVPLPDSGAAAEDEAPPLIASRRTITILRRSPPMEPPPVFETMPVEAPAPMPIPVTKAPMRITGKDLVLSDITGALGNRQLLRQAIVLREVLGPPLGLRR
jgi:hypothetical protein